MNSDEQNRPKIWPTCITQKSPTSQCLDWYAEGQSRIVEVDGVQIEVRFIGRKGRRGRIAIEAPAGAVFRSADLSDDIPPPEHST